MAKSEVESQQCRIVRTANQLITEISRVLFEGHTGSSSTHRTAIRFHITTTTSGTSLLDLLRPLLSGDALAVVALVALTLPWIFLGRFLERTDDFEEALAEAEASSDRSTVVALP